MITRAEPPFCLAAAAFATIGSGTQEMLFCSRVLEVGWTPFAHGRASAANVIEAWQTPGTGAAGACAD